MKKSHSAEMLLMVFSAVGGGFIYSGGWYILLGGIVLIVTSYFLTSILKTATIKEYLDAVSKEEVKNGN